jgi:hypothetical protein
LVVGRDVEERFVPTGDEDVVLSEGVGYLPTEEMSELACETTVFQRAFEKPSIDKLFCIDIVGLYCRITPTCKKGSWFENSCEFPCETITTAVCVFAPVGDSEIQVRLVTRYILAKTHYP